MSWNVVPLSGVPPMPWRNGGGVTRELVAWPDAENWSWRVSVAEVARDGAFSHFEGVQRWLAILEGAGVRLSMGENVIELTQQSAPLTFSGEISVHCNLLSGPVQDLNLMLRERANVGQMQRVCGVQNFVIEVAKIFAVYSVSAPAVLQLNGKRLILPKSALAWQSLPAGAELTIETSDAILMQIMSTV